MNRIISYLFTFVVLLFVSLAVHAKDDITKKVIDLPDFSSIYLNSGYTVYLKQTNKQEVEVQVLTEVFEQTELEVKDGVLHINIKRDESAGSKSFWAKMDKIKINPTMNIYISMRRVNQLMVNGSGKIVSENSINAPNLNLAVNGSGSMDLDIKGTTVKSEVTGSGDLSLKGYADNLNVTLGGSGNLKSFDFEILKANVKVMGSGKCEVHASEEVDIKIYGSGTVAVKGNTKNLKQKIYGSGKVERSY